MAIHFLPLIAALMGKKFLIFQIAKAYGFPRLYRQIMNLNRQINGFQTETYNSIRNGVQTIFRVPSKTYEVIENNTGFMNFLKKAEEEQAKNPTIINSIGMTLFKQTEFYKTAQKVKAFEPKKK